MIVVTIQGRAEGEGEFLDAPIAVRRRQHDRNGEKRPADHGVAVVEPSGERRVFVDVTYIGAPVETERPVDGEQVGILHRQVGRRRDIGERRHDGSDQHDLRRAAEDEHHLRIAPLRRHRIGVGKAGVKPDIGDRNGEAGQLEREVRQRQAERQHDSHGADENPIEQEEPPRGLHVNLRHRL